MIIKEVTDHGKLVITRLSGDITGQDVIDDFFAMFRLTNQLDQAAFAHLYDMSGVTSITMHDNDIRRMTSLGMSKGISKVDVITAIVATDPECRRLAFLHKDLSTILKIKRVEIFDSREDALSWLQENLGSRPDPELRLIS